MRSYVFGIAAAVAMAMVGGPSQAATVYYNLFNVEGESAIDVGFVTYNSLSDMLNDTNRQDVRILPGDLSNGRDNIVGSGADGTTFWNLFNVEGESSQDIGFVTYSTFSDMLNDTNRQDVRILPGNLSNGRDNIVGTGSDGTTYWNLFNLEGESALDVGFVTYSSLSDMLNDTNRQGVFILPGDETNGRDNIVGTGSDGTTYWNLFNVEGESAIDVGFVTYNSLSDMLNDTNRQGVFILPGDLSNGRDNIVGTGAFFVPDAPPPPQGVPLPASAWLVVAGLGALAAARGRSRRASGAGNTAT